jgi:HlyD family secretion protein
MRTREVTMASTLIWNWIRYALPAMAATAVALACALPSSVRAQDQRPPTRSDSPARKWDATAPGRIEPRTPDVRVVAGVAGRIAEVRVKTNDKVFAGQLLVRLDDEEALARLAGAEAQVAARERVADDQRRKGPADRRRAEDDVADAARAVAQAWDGLDIISTPRDTMPTAVEDAALSSARSALARAQDQLRQKQEALRRVKDDAGLPTREESELSAARADLMLAQVALQKTRIRAPIAGNVLQLRARVGEMAIPSPDQWLVLLGDLSGLSVRAELDEHDFAKVRVGQRVVVRAYAFPDREFEGRVRSIARYVGPGRLSSQGQRNKLTDIDVADVMVDLTDPGPLAVGMQADVYFSSDGESPTTR